MNLRAKAGLALLTLFCALVLLAVATRTPASPGQLAATGNTAVGRFSHTATLLNNGKVLVAGGMNRNGVWLDSAEIYDPVSGRFAPTAKMLGARAGATATLLANGKVLVAGGNDGSGKSLASAEIYDPGTGSFSGTGSMTMPRGHAVAVQLKTGKILIAGGSAEGDDEQLTTAELYDPTTGRFTRTGSMHQRRSCFTAAVLKNGRVLVAGGLGGGRYPNHKVEATAEIYDPETERFIETGSMEFPRFKQGSALLPDGRVLIAGGSNEIGRQITYSSTEIFDPQTGKFSSGPQMKLPRYKLTSGVVALNDGRILLAGGAEHPEIYDPARSLFIQLSGDSLDGFLFSTATVLHDGRVLLVNGYGHHPTDGAVTQAFVWRP
ncbi:MAG TPA: kelch repeat-containing protein [Candidatus Sulfotelmatobacter sp.]|nr:kelch repeat-containing protein [Candidatus Sulfotelmatobacter sp.]